jgi:hypothetical protein
MPFSISAAIVSSQLIIPVADRVPNFDVRPSCRESSISDCLGQEQIARGRLIEEWPHFTAQEKARCAADAKYGGAPSYVGWLTCLQINADTRNVPVNPGAAGQSTTTGAAAGGNAGSGGGDPSSGPHRSRRDAR